MDLIIADGSVPLANADLVPSTGTPQYATDGNPATGVPATVAPAYHYNMLTAELYAFLAAAGITPSGGNWGQVLAATKKLFSTTYIAQGSSSIVLPTGLIIQTFATPGVTLGAANVAVSFNVTYPIAFPNKLLLISARDNGNACIVWNSFVNPGLASSQGYVWSAQAGSGNQAAGACVAIGY